jgi:hypothetical protein
VSDATRPREKSTEQLLDAMFTVGQYNLVSWALNSFGVPLDDFLPGAWPYAGLRRKARAGSAVAGEEET